MSSLSKVLTLRDKNGDVIPAGVAQETAKGQELPAAVSPGGNRRARPRRRGNPLLWMSAVLFIILPVLGAAYFYATVASDQFISEFKLSVRGPEAGGGAGAGGGAAVIGGMISDAFVVTELINSRQMVADVSADIDLRKILVRD